MIKVLSLLLALTFLSSCATNQHDADIATAKYQALTQINDKLNAPTLIECEAKCKASIARENRVMFTAQMLQDFTSIDRLIAGGVSVIEIAAKGIFNPATLQAYAMYKSMEVIGENGGTRITNTDSGNVTSGDSRGDVSGDVRGDEIRGDEIVSGDTEIVSGIKAGGDVEQNPVSTATETVTAPVTNTSTTTAPVTTTDNSQTGSNNVTQTPTVTDSNEVPEVPTL